MHPQFLTLPGRKLAYGLQAASGQLPGIIFLGGYASDMTGTKASFLSDFCTEKSLSFVRFDYRGHGASSGQFQDLTIGDWFDDALKVFDALTKGPQIVVGSSMGGWIGMMLALARPDLVRAFIGVAAAPDFTEELFWKTLSDERRAKLIKDGRLVDETVPQGATPHDSATITLKLVEEARRHLLLTQPLGIAQPVRLIQGQCDDEVPWHHALKIAEVMQTGDVRVTLVKDGDHRLSRPQDLALLAATIAEFL